MPSPTAVIDTRAPGRPRVTLNSCPRCLRPLILTHAVDVLPGGGYDLTMVASAQNLHLAQCTG